MRFRQPSLLLQIFMHDSFLFRATNIAPAKREQLQSFSNLRHTAHAAARAARTCGRLRCPG